MNDNGSGTGAASSSVIRSFRSINSCANHERNAITKLTNTALNNATFVGNTLGIAR